jgi:Glycosyl hydrolases family 25
LTLYGIDISNNNFSSVSQVWDLMDSLVSQGISWVESKCSEGNYFSDPYWQPTQQACRSVGISCVPYHYVTTDDPASQAATFVANGGGASAMIDFEANSGDLGNLWNVVNAFNTAGIDVILGYIPQWYLESIGGDLSALAPNGIALISSAYPDGSGSASDVYANSGGDDGEGWQSYAGATPAIWQFTDSASVAGFVVDCNAFQGTLDQLTALLGGTVTQPAIPEPTDQADQVSQLWGQLLTRWDFLGGNTPVEALGAIGEALKISGYSNPAQGDSQA